MNQENVPLSEPSQPPERSQDQPNSVQPNSNQPNSVQPNSNQPSQKTGSVIVQKEFRDLFNVKSNDQKDRSRRILMNLVVFFALLSILAVEYLCLWEGCCFGDNIEMNSVVSQAVFPLLLLYLLLSFLQYKAVELISKQALFVVNVVNFIVAFSFLLVAFISIGFAVTKTDSSHEDEWSLLSIESRQIDYSDSISNLTSNYLRKMLITGFIFLALAIFVIILLVMMFIFTRKCDGTWRPVITSRLSDRRAIQLTALYQKLSNQPSFDEYFTKPVQQSPIAAPVEREVSQEQIMEPSENLPGEPVSEIQEEQENEELEEAEEEPKKRRILNRRKKN